MKNKKTKSGKRKLPKYELGSVGTIAAKPQFVTVNNNDIYSTLPTTVSTDLLNNVNSSKVNRPNASQISNTVSSGLGMLGDMVSSMNTNVSTGHEQDADKIRNSINFQGQSVSNANNQWASAFESANLMNTYQPAYIDRSGTNYSDYNSSGNLASGIGNTLSSAASGAAAGSIVPGIGTAIGAGVGALVGGIKSIFNRKKIRNQVKQRRQEVAEAEAAEAERRAAAEKQSELNLTNVSHQRFNALNDDYTQTTTFAKGGIVGIPNAIVDHGEVLRTPDGSLDVITEGSSRITDNVLANLPAGTQILSDRLKMPNTGMSFAEKGRQLVKSVEKSQKQYDKTGDRFAKASLELNKANAQKEFDNLLAIQEYMKTNSRQNKKQKGYADGTQGTIPQINVYGKRKKRIPQLDINNEFIPVLPNMITLDMADVTLPTSPLNSKGVDINDENNNKVVDWFKDNWGTLLGNAAALTPTLYNTIKGFGSYDTVDPYYVNGSRFYNALGNQAIRKMTNRRYNIQPELEENRVQTNIGRYNTRKYNTNTGANLASDVALVAGRMRADANAWAKKNNMDNQYLAEEAQMMANIGAQNANAERFAYSNNMNERRYAQDYNARSKANRDNMLATGLTQLSDYAQNAMLMRNQRNRDMSGLDLWRLFASLGMSDSNIKEILNSYGK